MEWTIAERINIFRRPLALATSIKSMQCRHEVGGGQGTLLCMWIEGAVRVGLDA